MPCQYVVRRRLLPLNGGSRDLRCTLNSSRTSVTYRTIFRIRVSLASLKQTVPISKALGHRDPEIVDPLVFSPLRYVVLVFAVQFEKF